MFKEEVGFDFGRVRGLLSWRNTQKKDLEARKNMMNTGIIQGEGRLLWPGGLK